ncbi:hypothetical protein ABI_42860 [Asticcacaulis biprosthecium C19]|uniref:Uncharacterized protein n=1 Tax=Asticcacaulis biprosthecium C19 TaxID=715226 RepID=F4QSZ3_9CAUL|nr:hypothetical protein [Asticcacaulis biprosthecium]EGF89863.1 hypothetical protein ABI_42860 [Asticcacaulis biprosthecium C19]
MTDANDKKAYLAAQSRRNLFIAGGLLVFVILVFFVTMVQMGRNTRGEKLKVLKDQAAAASSAAPASQ